MIRIRKIGSIFLVFLSIAALRSDIAAQVRPSNDYGILGLAQRLEEVQSTKSVMMIGAHPDDEDSALIAYLARGEHARTAYLSLTRGDGGQNIIGPELFEPLGVIRTEELLQARRLDGAEQYFTRAFDYGFSKTLDEARSKWPVDVIKCDAVRAIRLFRPLVVIARFSGTPEDGHGQHQYSGYLAPIAVKAAADPQQCTDAGDPWKVQKFYVETSFGDTSPGVLRVNTGTIDPILGRSYFEIAMEGRSQHKSQGEGRLELRGDQYSGLRLVGSNVKEKSIFDGLDTRKKLAKVSLDNKRQLLDRLLAAYPTSARKDKIAEAVAFLAGLRIDALADSETIIAGEPTLVSVKAYKSSPDVKIGGVDLVAPYRWSITEAEAPTTNSPANVVRETAQYSRYFSVKATENPWFTQPYWLIAPREAGLFRWSGTTNDETLPFQRGPLTAKVRVEISGREIVFERDVQYRFADEVRGDTRRNVDFVPRVNVEMEQPLILINSSDRPQTKRIRMWVTNNSNSVLSGTPSISLDSFAISGRAVTPAFELKRKGERSPINWDITFGPNIPAGNYSITGEAVIGGVSFVNTMHTVSYPHIQTHRYYTPATLKVVVLDLNAPALNIGYIRGSGDEVPDAIRQMGMNVTMLEEKDLKSGDLSRFKTIVVGIRASETRPDLLANNERLLDYVRNGGNLIVQYQRGNWTSLAPFPINTVDKQGTAAGSIARVVDESAPVEILAPSHPAFLSPNKITNDDFNGWVQERNAYNLVTFDQRYVPLLESHDAGELPNKGGLVIAAVGKGNWVYCSYSFFRQLPAGVPGAYRLFANLLDLPPRGE